jgi:hypothetical protein
MSLYKALVDFAKCPHTGEGWNEAVKKAEKWRDALDEMIEVASPGQRERISDLMEPLKLFFEEYAKWSKWNSEPWTYLGPDTEFEIGDEAIEIGGTTWFEIVDSVGSTLNKNKNWGAARRPKH